MQAEQALHEDALCPTRSAGNRLKTYCLAIAGSSTRELKKLAAGAAAAD